MEKYTHAELIEEYKAAETRYLKEVFQDDYAAGLKTYDLVDHLDTMAIKHGFYGDDHYEELKKGLKCLGKNIGTLINGERGERYTENALRHIMVRNEVLPNVCVKLNGETAEVDFVVLTRKGLFLVESKFYTCDIVVDESGVIRGAYSPWWEDYNTCQKLKSKEFVLSGALEPFVGALADHANFHSMIVIANNDCHWKDNSHRYHIGRCWDVAHDIEAFDGDDVFTDEQIDELAGAIREISTTLEYPMTVNLQAIDGGLAYVLDLIADASCEDEPLASESNHDVAIPVTMADLDMVEYDDGYGWLWGAGAITIIMGFLYGAYRRPDLLRKVGRAIIS